MQWNKTTQTGAGQTETKTVLAWAEDKRDVKTGQKNFFDEMKHLQISPALLLSPHAENQPEWRGIARG
jgi:hypothetical protein